MKITQSRKLPKFIILGLIIIVSVISVVMAIKSGDAPTTKKQNLFDYYLEDEETAAIVVNGRLTSIRAKLINKEPYVSLGLVSGEINSCFYYESSSNHLLCTTADKVTTATKDSQNNGAPVFFDVQTYNTTKKTTETTLADDERIYVQLSYVAQFTEIEVHYYSSPARVFIRSKFGDMTHAFAAEDACIRTEAANSGLVLEELEGGEELWVVKSENGWNLVCHEVSGISGYISDAELENTKTVAEKCSYTAPETRFNLLNEKVCLVWHQTLTESGVSNFDKLIENATEANVVSPTWFSVVGSDGSLESRASHDYVEKAKEKGLQVWALVENFNTTNDLDYSLLFGTSSARENLISGLIDQAREYDLDGINVDFEGLPSSCGYDYVQFMRELSIACHENDIILSVDCYVPSSWTTHYHRDLLADVVDYLIIMAYDEHYDGSEAGSTASLSFVKNGIQDTINLDVPAERIIVGVPFYSRLWKGDGESVTSSTISMNDMKSILDNAGESAIWYDEIGQYYVEREVDGVTQRLWVENYDSMKCRLELIDSFDVSGIACWRLGMENSDAWSAINEYLN